MNHKQNSSSLSPLNVLSFLFQEERRSGVILILAAITALILANSSWSHIYFDFLNNHFTFGSVTLDIQHWVSEGLMALFFLVVTLEVKREFIDGELHSWKKASFPVFAAIGGMLIPALMYLVLNHNSPQSSGWAIPIATDIAIAVGVLALLGNRIPKNLRVFLLALAIIDDIGSIIIIGLFYNHPTNLWALVASLILGVALFLFRNQRYWIPVFIIMGFLLWYCLTLSGISGTMAGVILAILAPLASSRSAHHPLQSSEKIEDKLLPITAYIIVPLFVFCSAGLQFNAVYLRQPDSFSVFIGVVVGLLLGKPIGIFTFSWIFSKLQLTSKPHGISWTHLLGGGFIAGIGFTISLLIAELSFSAQTNLQNAAIFGIFVGSILAGLTGLMLLSSNPSNSLDH